MSDVQTWSTTAASNNSSSPDGFPEGMAPSGVNDSAREIMAALAKYRSDTDGVNSSTGSSNAYVLAASRTMTAYAQGDLFTFKANFTNTGATTINVDALGAKAIQANTAALVGGEIVSGGVYTVVYDGTQFQLLNPAPFARPLTVEATPYTTYTNISVEFPVDDSIPQITEGVELVTVAITPRSTSSRLVITAEFTGALGATGSAGCGIFQDSTADALSSRFLRGATNEILSFFITHEMAAGTTSSTTFRLRAGPSATAANLYVNGSTTTRLGGGVSAVRMRVTEYAP